MGPQGPGSGKRAVGTEGHHGPPWASSELGLTSGATTSLLLPPKKKGKPSKAGGSLVQGTSWSIQHPSLPQVTEWRMSKLCSRSFKN